MRGFCRLVAMTTFIGVLSLAASCRRGDGRGAQTGGSETAAGSRAAVELKVGDPAPLFSLPGSDGKTYSLVSYKGKQAVVLAWISKAFSLA